MNVREQNYYHQLYEIAAEIGSADSREKILQSIVRSVSSAMKAKGCSLLLLSEDKKSLIHTISFGLSAAFTEAGPRSIDKSMPETLVGKGTVAFVYKLMDEKDRVQFPDLALAEGIVSILAVPVRLRDDIIGQLRVYTAEPRRFSEDDIYFVQAVANLGAIAMENTSLRDSCQRAYDALTGDFVNFRFTR